MSVFEHGRELALAAVIGATLTLSNVSIAVIVFTVMLTTMTFELLTCWGAHRGSPLVKKYNWNRHIASKLMVISLLVPALCLDIVMVVMARQFPATVGLLPTDHIPVTMVSMIWILTGQAIDGVENVRQSQGDRHIPPVVLWVIRQLRKVDRERYTGPGEPQRRLIDDLTEDDVVKLLDEMRGDDTLDGPPPPFGHGPPVHDTRLPGEKDG